MIVAAMLWNEPNNKSHWDPETDPDWTIYAEMVRAASVAVRAVRPDLPIVLGGMSPIDPLFVQRMDRNGALAAVDIVGVHGFPLDWNLWSIHEWPHKIREIEVTASKPVWVTEVGVSSFGAEEVQDWGLARTVELLGGRAPVVHWYSLFDLPRAWDATTRHREAEGASYYRHFHMGLVREDGAPKLAYKRFRALQGRFGLCQWLHFEDHRLELLADHLDALQVKTLRTGLSWADSFRPGAERWFDRMMRVLEPFDVTVTFCFTPEHLGLAPHHTSAPRDVADYARFCADMVKRYASA